MTLVNTPVASVRAANDTPTSYEEFLDVLAGLRLSSSRIDIDIDRGQVTLDGRDAGLSAKEHDLLAHLAANADRSVTRDELFASVWADSELGPALVGIDLSNPDDIDGLRHRMEASPLHVEELPLDSEITRLVI